MPYATQVQTGLRRLDTGEEVAVEMRGYGVAVALGFVF
jgi:hypothetical protein